MTRQQILNRLEAKIRAYKGRMDCLPIPLDKRLNAADLLDDLWKEIETLETEKEYWKNIGNNRNF